MPCRLQLESLRCLMITQPGGPGKTDRRLQQATGGWTKVVSTAGSEFFSLELPYRQGDEEDNPTTCTDDGGQVAERLTGGQGKSEG